MKYYPRQSVCPYCKTIYRYGDLNGLKWKKQTECYHCHQKLRVKKSGIRMLAAETAVVCALLNLLMLGVVKGVSFLALFLVNLIPAAAAVMLLPLYIELVKEKR